MELRSNYSADHNQGNTVRLALDTNIVVSALPFGGTPRQLLKLGRDGQISFFTSSQLLEELEDVLQRDGVAPLLAAKNITPTFLMQRYGMLAQLVKPQPIERTVRDIDDDVVIATALAAQADIIATGDNDLLVLHPYRDIWILNAAKTLEVVVHG